MAAITVERDVPVEMRDGVELATDVYRPASGGSHPTLVHRIPYNKSFAWFAGSLMFNPLEAVERGYAVVIQDTRGRFNSEGEWEPFHNEAADGYDAIEWAADQEWSNGRVGIYGSSYMGVTTWQAAVADPPHLEAAVAYLTGGNYHDGWTYAGGAFELGFNLHWALGLSWDTLSRLDIEESERERIRDELTEVYQNPEAFADSRPLAELQGVHEAAPYWEEWLDHSEYDSYWEDLDVTQHVDDISVPVMHIGGWFDNFLRGHLDVHQAVQEQDEAPDQERFIIGPWDHGAYLSSTPVQVGDVRYPPEMAGGPSFVSERTLEWFDHWLCDDPLPADEQSGVEYVDLSRETWHETDTWPPETTTETLFLSSGGAANSRFGDGRLVDTSPAQEPTDSYVYDPEDPVPSRGGRTLMPEMREAGIKDQSTVEERDDVLVYTGPRLTEPLSIAGPVDVRLYAASSAPDTDFTAKLVDVGPDGYCGNVAEGILRARYRNGMDEASPLTPGETYALDISLWDVAYTFETGHRVRLEISSSNFPRYDPHPNIAGDIGHATEEDLMEATQRVYHDDERPSHLTLPVVE